MDIELTQKMRSPLIRDIIGFLIIPIDDSAIVRVFHATHDHHWQNMYRWLLMSFFCLALSSLCIYSVISTETHEIWTKPILQYIDILGLVDPAYLNVSNFFIASMIYIAYWLACGAFGPYLVCRLSNLFGYSFSFATVYASYYLLGSSMLFYFCLACAYFNLLNLQALIFLMIPIFCLWYIISSINIIKHVTGDSVVDALFIWGLSFSANTILLFITTGNHNPLNSELFYFLI